LTELAEYGSPEPDLELPDDAAAAMYRLHRARIYAYCVGQLRDRQEADDAVQSTFLYAFAALQRGVRPRTALPWLYTIAHNVCRTRRRALKRRSRLESGVALDAVQDSIGRDDRREDVAGLSASLAALPEAQRRAFVLREWQGLSYSEIATRLGITESAVEGTIFRARRSLARRLQHTRELASCINGVFLIRGARRLVSLATAAKPAATAVALGVVAGSALIPLADTPVKTSRPHTTHPIVAIADAPTIAKLPRFTPSPSRDTRAATAAPARRAPSPLARPLSVGSSLPVAPSAETATVVAPASPAPPAAAPPSSPEAATPGTAAAAPATPGTPAAESTPPSIDDPVQTIADSTADVVDATNTVVADAQGVAAHASATVEDTAKNAISSAVATVTTVLPPLPVPPKQGTLLNGRP
jgi:RNA polymerase sigma factor (sigma-70 family)